MQEDYWNDRIQTLDLSTKLSVKCGTNPDKYWIKIILIKVKNVGTPCSVVCRADCVSGNTGWQCQGMFPSCSPVLVLSSATGKHAIRGLTEWQSVWHKTQFNSLPVRPGKANGSKVSIEIITSDGLNCHFLILWLPTLADDIQIYNVVGDPKMSRCWDVDALWMIYFHPKSCNVNWQSSDWTKSQFDRE